MVEGQSKGKIASREVSPRLSVPSLASRATLDPFRWASPAQSADSELLHLWVARLNLEDRDLAAFANTLSQTELDRAARFRFDVHRNRYIASHGWMRRLLGGYLSVPPVEVKFQAGAKGKPALTSSSDTSGIQFNLAHSEDLALIGVSRRSPIGVDLEHVHALEDVEELVKRFFSKRETLAFQDLPQELKSQAFFNLWTRKEAWLKATGEGIAHLLDRVEVSFVPGEPARLLSLPSDFTGGLAWSVHDVDVQPGFTAAVAVPAARFETEVHWATELTEIGL